jgi:CrcB protein
MPQRNGEGDMSVGAFLAVGVGAAVGAWLRWWLSLLLNPIVPPLPMGTLVANLVGGYLIGVAVELLGQHTTLAPELRLFVITGFLGGLTTFSAFSAEAVLLIQRLEWGWLLLLVSVHVLGSIAMTLLGVASVRALLGVSS